MPIAWIHVTIDSVDAAALAGFWSDVLDHPVDEGASEHFATIGLQGLNRLWPAWMFIAVPERKTIKNRVHLDFGAQDPEAEIERVVALGATRVADFDEFDTRWTTLRDPEGNEFDIAAAGH